MADHGIPGVVLMERAGHGVADAVMRLAAASRLDRPAILLFAGKGNNGGDAFVAARILHEQGRHSVVWLSARASEVTGDARTHLDRMVAAGVSLYELPEPAQWGAVPGLEEMSGPAIVVDGLLGTGIEGAARGSVACAIRVVNRLGLRCPVVAIDIPSGLNSDTGLAAGEAVTADVTVTMALPKAGLTEPAALNCVGSVEVVDIGIPGDVVDSVDAVGEMIAAADLGAMLSRRERASHKGTYGHVLILAGAPGFAGAAMLAARAAIRSGTGLVSALVPQSIAASVDAAVPEAMVHPGAMTASGALSADCLDDWGRDPGAFDAILAGPGLTAADSSRELVERLLACTCGPLVLDADALNVVAGRTGLLLSAKPSLVLTPHPGELARLLDCSTDEVQSDRRAAVRQASEATGAVVILKGAGTLVAAPDGETALNLTGNPGMASGGTGDVLAGLLAGLLAQGHPAVDAARLAVFLHGRAGDLAAWRGSQLTLTAGDVIEALPAAAGRKSLLRGF